MTTTAQQRPTLTIKDLADKKPSGHVVFSPDYHGHSVTVGGVIRVGTNRFGTYGFGRNRAIGNDKSKSQAKVPGFQITLLGGDVSPLQDEFFPGDVLPSGRFVLVTPLTIAGRYSDDDRRLSVDATIDVIKPGENFRTTVAGFERNRQAYTPMVGVNGQNHMPAGIFQARYGLSLPELAGLNCQVYKAAGAGVLGASYPYYQLRDGDVAVVTGQIKGGHDSRSVQTFPRSTFHAQYEIV